MKWLYGFHLPECHTGLTINDNFPQMCFFLVDLFGLATKYILPKLKEEIESLFKTSCSTYAASPTGKARAGFWYLPLLRHLLTNPYAAPALRDTLIASFRANTFRVQALTDKDKCSFWAELHAWPELTFFLLATGGLDGKTFRMFPDGQAYQLAKPAHTADTPVRKASPVKKKSPMEKSTPSS